MNRLITLALVGVLPGCAGLLESDGVSPEVIPQAIEKTEKIASDLGTGNYVGALVGAGSLAVLLLGKKGFSWAKERVENSAPGTIFGGPTEK